MPIPLIFFQSSRIKCLIALVQTPLSPTLSLPPGSCRRFGAITKEMFQIDRSYIEKVDLESLQSRIWDIRTDFKDDPTLPRIENYGTTEEVFEAYLEKRQKLEDFKTTWRQRRLLILGTMFCLTLALFSLFLRNMKWEAYAVAFMLCMLIYMVYMTIVAYRSKPFHNNPNETFLKALLFWDDNRQTEQ